MTLVLKTRKKRGKYTALIDGDIIVYRIGFACESKDDGGNIVVDSIENCLHSVKLFIQGILDGAEAKDYKIYLTGEGNFRHEVVDDYKANRATARKPVHYEAIRTYLQERWGAEVIRGKEADDELAYQQTIMHTYKLKEWDSFSSTRKYSSWADDKNSFMKMYTTIICTIDKDLDQVMGWHYNPVKKEKYWVSEEEGTRFLYQQMLTGDSVDNIHGCKGIGPVKAKKILAECKTEQEMLCKVGLYYAIHFDDPEEQLWINSALLYMKRTPLGTFQPGEEILGQLYDRQTKV